VGVFSLLPFGPLDLGRRVDEHLRKCTENVLIRLSFKGTVFDGAGVLDFAGGIVIHISSGTASIVASKSE
jgi:hypothetical protein